MTGLIPTEFHKYSVLDVVRSVLFSFGPMKASGKVSLPGLGDGNSIRSARAALVIALKALDMKEGSKIGVPLYCCPVVFKAIRAAGCVPRFLDIDPETYCLSSDDLKMKQAGIDAVVAVHMFGNLCDMPRILEIMGGRPVIEDCAQSLGSKLEGGICGSFGDISFFSFRSGKYLSVGEGGVLFSREAKLSARIAQLTEVLPAPTRGDEWKHIINTYVRSKLRSRPWWGLLGSWIWGVYNRKTEFIDKSPIELGTIFRSDWAMINRRMPMLEALIAKQRAHAAYYEEHLRIDPALLSYQKPRVFYNRLLYPITFPSAEHRNRMAAFLRDHLISTSRPYEDIIEGAAKHYSYEGDCPIADRVLRRTLVIPTHSELKPSDVRRIASLMNEGWALITRES